MPRKIRYLIDTENIGSAWTEVLPLMGRNDEILLFYTVNSPGIPYRDLQQIMNHLSQMELIPCNTGRNGLDFQLSSYLGYLLRSSTKTQYVILSKDTGYDPLIQFWKEKGVDIARCAVHEVIELRAREADAPARLPEIAAADTLPAPARLQEAPASGQEEKPVRRTRQAAGKRGAEAAPERKAAAPKAAKPEKQALKAAPETAEPETKVQQAKTTQPDKPEARAQQTKAAQPAKPETRAQQTKAAQPAKSEAKVQQAEPEAESKQAAESTRTRRKPARRGKSQSKEQTDAAQDREAALAGEVQGKMPESLRSQEDVRDLISIVRESYPNGLQEVNKALMSRFGYDSGNDVYRALKPSFREICGADRESPAADKA